MLESVIVLQNQIIAQNVPNCSNYVTDSNRQTYDPTQVTTLPPPT